MNGKRHISDSNLITGCRLVYYVTRLHNVSESLAEACYIKEQNKHLMNTKIQYQYIKLMIPLLVRPVLLKQKEGYKL